jgi:hypothetical protein
VSCSTAVEPEVVSPAVALQVLVPTVQLNAVAAQSAGGATTKVVTPVMEVAQAAPVVPVIPVVPGVARQLSHLTALT